MPNARRLSANLSTAALLLLSYAALALALAASPADAARVHCASKAANASRRLHEARHRCHAAARKSHAHKRPKRRSSAPAAVPSQPEGTSAAPAAKRSTAASNAATIAAVLAAPCQNTELTPEAADIALVREAVLCLINRKRAEHDETPLRLNPELEQAAEGHCQELIADDYFAHVSPTGETPVDRVRATGYIPSPSDGYVIGENLAWGTYQLSTPQSIVAAWFASPGHLANILEAQYRETGIGVMPAVPASLAAEAPGATYAQEFGVIIP